MKILVILAIFVKVALSADLACYFIVHSDGYNCHVENVFAKSNELTSVNGTHRNTKTNSMVDVLFIPSASKTEYLPQRSCEYFNNLVEYECFGVNLMEIFRENFKACDNLNLLLIQNAKFSTIPEDVFMDLQSMTVLEIGKTRLSFLPEKIFQNNQKLMKIDLKENHLMVINAVFPPTVFSIFLLKNDCINKNFSRPSNEIYQKCSNESSLIKIISDENTEKDRVLSMIKALELSIDVNRQQIEELKVSSQNIQRISIENVQKVTSIQKTMSQTMQAQKLVAVSRNDDDDLSSDKLERIDVKISELKRENENHQKRFRQNEILQYVSGTLILVCLSIFVLLIITLKFNRRHIEGLLMQEY